MMMMMTIMMKYERQYPNKQHFELKKAFKQRQLGSVHSDTTPLQYIYTHFLQASKTKQITAIIIINKRDEGVKDKNSLVNK
jgi:hypothetical protein